MEYEAVEGLKPHQVFLIGVVAIFAILVTYLFFNLVQAVGVGLIVGAFTDSFLLSEMEREGELLKHADVAMPGASSGLQTGKDRMPLVSTVVQTLMAQIVLIKGLLVSSANHGRIPLRQHLDLPTLLPPEPVQV